MSEILHVWALAPAAVGTCCLAAPARRARAPELAASALMLVAMLDAATIRLVPAVFAAAMLMAGALALAAWRARRGRGRSSPRGCDEMTLHTTLGMVLMAALLLVMGATGHADAGPSAVGAHAAHGAGPGAGLGVLVVSAVAIYAAGSLVAAARSHGWLDRAQFASMGISALAMGAALLV